MNILGISCFFHDASAVLLQDGRLMAAAEEERFTRKKHDYSFPSHAIKFCLKEGEISGKDLDYVLFFEKPFLKFERILMTVMQTYPRSLKVFQDAMINWFGNKLWVKSLIQKELGIPSSRILFSEHHLSHAASAFLCSPFQESAILTVDGVGEWTTASFGVGRGNNIKLLKEIRFPHSLGLLYSTFTAFLGFEVNEGEYKVMGMAPFGKPRYKDKIYKLLRLASDGSFELDLDYFSFHYSPDRTFSPKFESLFGRPRPPSDRFFTLESGYPSYFGEKPSNFESLAKENQHYADIAASIQEVVEEILLQMARHVHQETGLTNLCLAGGVALNSVANGRILRETPFKQIYIQPAAGDGGGALGAALYLYHDVLGKPRSRASGFSSAYLGEDNSNEDVKKFLDENGIKAKFLVDRLLNETVTDLLARKKVIGWVKGRFEWGPRALGARSILADPRDKKMKDLVNAKIKFREAFRPFAPVALYEEGKKYFETEAGLGKGQIGFRQQPLQYMLAVVPVNSKWQDRLGAITHVDGTARPQLIKRNVNKNYYDVIRCFGQKAGVNVLLNTSFNLKGQPIVNTPEEAYDTFMKSGIDILVLEN